MKEKKPIDKQAVKAIYEDKFIELGTPDEILCDDDLFEMFLRDYEFATKMNADAYSLKKTLLNLRKSKKLPTQNQPQKS